MFTVPGRQFDVRLDGKCPLSGDGGGGRGGGGGVSASVGSIVFLAHTRLYTRLYNTLYNQRPLFMFKTPKPCRVFCFTHR